MRRSLLLVTAFSVAWITPALASSDSGISFRCHTVNGHYVWRNGSICFPHESAASWVKHQQSVIVRH